MKKYGDFWLPDIDTRWGKIRRKSRKAFGRGRGTGIPELEEALKYCKRWTIAIDGGANVGGYTKILMERFEHVHAFEPAPDTFEALAKNVEEWGGGDRVTLHPVAISDRVESVSLGGAEGRRSLSRRVVGGGDIPAMRIDDLDLPDLAFIKLDLEGYEERALRGAEETLRRFKPLVMCEHKPHKSGIFGDADGARGFLESIGAKPLASIPPKHIDWVFGF
jgi:FkbM family methyltransferase